jgi:hypothetical protein
MKRKLPEILTNALHMINIGMKLKILELLLKKPWNKKRKN